MLCSTDLFKDWGNSSNNLSDYIIRYGETQMNIVFTGYKEGYLCFEGASFAGVSLQQCLDRFAVLWILLITYSV